MDCKICSHIEHDAGKCKNCDCGLDEIVRGSCVTERCSVAPAFANYPTEIGVNHRIQFSDGRRVRPIRPSF